MGQNYKTVRLLYFYNTVDPTSTYNWQASSSGGCYTLEEGGGSYFLPINYSNYKQSSCLWDTEMMYNEHMLARPLRKDLPPP